MTTLKHIGVLAHPLRPPTAPVAEQIAEQLQARGVTAWAYTTWIPDDVEAAVAESEMVIAIGGDGAMLRAARVCAVLRAVTIAGGFAIWYFCCTCD